MDYSTYSIDELNKMLDAVVRDYTNGDMDRSSYTIKFNELYEALTSKQREKEAPEIAYERAMRGLV